MRTFIAPSFASRKRLGLCAAAGLLSLATWCWAATIQTGSSTQSASTMPTTEPTTRSVAFDSPESELVATLFEDFVQHIVRNEYDKAEPMVIPAPHAAAGGTRRILETLHRNWERRATTPDVKAAHATGDTAVVMVTGMGTNRGNEPPIRNYYLLLDQGQWKMLGLSVRPYDEILTPEQLRQYRDLDKWSSVRLESFEPGD